MFAPVYRPSDGQQTFLARRTRRENKRRRDAASSDDDASSHIKAQPADSGSDTELDVRTHSVSKTDPYHVAGYSREAELPPPPFPHAPLKSPVTTRAVEEELAALNPPLYMPRKAPEDASTSLKRRHVENLTTVMHTCMLKRDWQRAARAWGLLLRTEIAGRGVDVRQHGRWELGAELLIRSNEEDGFKLAREYHDRLILQYPHTARTQNTINALVFYPALFETWICEVQDRFQKEKRQAKDESSGSASSETSDHEDPDVSMASISSESSRITNQQQLERALPIARRMDELLIEPPYDTSGALLQLRGTVGLWISDLYSAVGEGVEDGVPPDMEGRRERLKAMSSFQRCRNIGFELPQYALDLLDSDRTDEG
jgi:hypothetical protein